MAEFRMPSLGADMESGTVVAWHVAVGDRVARGDVVAEVDTDKSVIDVECFTTGTVEQLLVEEGSRVPVGTPLAIIAEDGAGPATTAAPAAPASADRLLASPLARRHAERLGVDLSAVTGTGPGGAITTSDVDHHATSHAEPPPHAAPADEPPPPPPPPPAMGPAPTPTPPSGPERRQAVRRAVAASMARSKREIPHYYLATDIDLSRMVRWLDARNADVPVTQRLLPVVVLLKATALALHETPDLNGFWDADAFRPAEAVHVGVAIALRGGGLVAPALHDTDRRPLDDLMEGLRDLVARARTGRLRSSEASDPTITVTHLGDQGVDVVHPVIYPPQVAIVGFGRVRPRPWAVDGMLAVRPVVTATLAADHRVTDGHRGAVLLTALDRLLQEPEAL
ncbi:dihydrolipoamide acetyltransferase family protein [Cellulomonas soli]|uniref:dihydrolipoamide acetyltransferase family protein n=1 Tax=Cellulomonas soli TaxID=931535 RepID=UPI003F848A4B